MSVTTLPAVSSAQRFLNELRREVAHHPAVNHLFLNRLATAPFSRHDYRVFAENHYPLVCVFTHYLELLLVRAPSSDAKSWLAKVLIDEYGEGSDGHDHAEMYGRFLGACGGDVADRRQVRVPRSALTFVREHQRIVTEEPFLVGLGAVGPGHEWSIPEMFQAVIPGLKRAGFTDAEIDYFLLHVVQDEDHGAWLEEALLRYADTEQAQQEIRRGALLSLDARGRFWDGVQRAVVTWRQPRSLRQEGILPRTIGREVALTSWDGVRVARAIEHGVEALRERMRPPLGDLLAKNREPLKRRRFRRLRALLEGT